MKTSLHATMLAVIIATASACDQGAAPAMDTAAALVERTSAATLAWTIDGDGKTALNVRSAMCEPMADKVTGTLKFVNHSDGSEKEVALERKGSQLVAAGPKLDPELTEVQYSLTVDGVPVTGSLHIPAEGTKALVEAAPEAAAAEADNKTAQEGGEVVTVGADKFEVAADEDTGVVKVFPLSPKGEIKEILLGVGGEESTVLVLQRVETPRLHFAGLLRNDGRGRSLTVGVKQADGKVRVALLGLRRKQARYVGVDAPRRHIWARKAWIDDATELKKNPKANAYAKGKHGDNGDSEDKGKVTICHRPPGNTDNPKTLEVGASAVKAHLAHGDTEGPCPDGEGKAKGDNGDSEHEGAEGKGSEGKGAEGKGSEGKGSEGKGAEGKGSEGSSQGEGKGKGKK